MLFNRRLSYSLLYISKECKEIKNLKPQEYLSSTQLNKEELFEFSLVSCNILHTVDPWDMNIALNIF